VLVRNEGARLAPAHSALNTFHVAKGAAVRVLEVYGAWSRIEAGDKFGWVPSESLAPRERPVAPGPPPPNAPGR
jgi:SH3-like domain-containing protein